MPARRIVAFLFSFIFLCSTSFNSLPVARAEGEEITLQIAKSVDKTDVAPGETFTYTLDYSISGNGEALNAKITDVLPAGLDYVSSIKTVHIDAVTTSTVDGRDAVTFTFVTPSATGISGKLRITARFRNGTTADGATAVNNATISADGLMDVVSNDVTVTAHVASPTWSVSKAQTNPTGTVVAGSSVQYRVRVNGNASGSLNLTDVRVTDTLPESASFVSATAGGTYDADTRKVSWSIASIPVGSSADRYVTVSYPEGQTADAVNSVSVLAKLYGQEEDQPEKTASCTTQFGAANPGMGSIVKTNRQVQEEYHVGQTAKYGISGASNTGNVALDNFTIEDVMPEQIDLTSITTGNFNDSLPMSVYYMTDADPGNWQLWKDTTTTANATLSVSALELPAGVRITRVRWSLGTVPAGFSQSTTIIVQGVIRQDAVGTVTNYAYLDSAYKGTPLPQSSSHVEFTLVGAYPWLVPGKALQGDAQRDFNTNVTWTLTVKNHDYATGSLTDPVAVDVLPPALQYVSWTCSAPAGVTVADPVLVDQTIGGVACKVVRWQITGSLEPGQQVTINLTTKIADRTPVGWQTNKFYITTNDPAAGSLKGAATTDTDDLDGDGASDDMLAGASAQVFVKFQGALTTQAEVKGELDENWKVYSSGSYGQTLPGGLADYRFSVKNDGSNGPISNIVAIDMLPTIGDRMIIGGAARGSQWTPYLVNDITGPDGAALPGELKIYYTTNPHPSFVELYDPVDGANAADGWSETPPADITAVTALKFVFGGYTLNPGDELSFEWPMRAPEGAPAGQLAWDSMTIGATCEGSDGPEAFLPTESSKVGFIINNHIPYFGIGDRVWVDKNGNGIQDAGEPGVNDVLVNLYDAAAPGTVLQYTRTGDNQSGSAGYWSFPALIANGTKQYIIEYVFPDSYRQTLYNADGATGDADTNTDSDVQNVTVGGGVVKGRITFTSPDYRSIPDGEEKPDKMNFDLGIFRPASLSGLVWNDLDHDGIQDGGEPALSGVSVSLKDAGGLDVTDADGNAVAGTTTDADGNYGFTNLKPGDYTVTVSNPDAANSIFTAANAGSDDARDSDANAATGAITSTLLSGDDITHLDAGLHKGMLKGRVWHDLDADGVQDAGEPGVPGVTVALNGGSTTAATDGSGNYTFTDLNAGNYTVEVQPGAFYVTYKDVGDDAKDSDADPATHTTDSFPIGLGQTVQGEDCGLFKSASFGGLVWNDRDWDGVQDEGEPAIAGSAVTLKDSQGNPARDVDGADASTATAGTDGRYSFSNLRPGAYTVVFSNPDAANYAFTLANMGTDEAKDSDADPATGEAAVALVSNTSDATADAGFHKGKLQGRVWTDTDADGVQDGGEAGIADVTIVARLGGSSWTTTTAADGSYSFIDLDAGSYTVEAQPAAGWYVTDKDATGDIMDSDFNPGTKTTDALDLGAGAGLLGVDCGLFQPASVGDFVWIDLDHDGVQDDGEPGIAGVSVSLKNSDGSGANDVDGVAITDATTDANGAYSFTKLRPGSYKITVANPDAANYAFSAADQGGDDAKDSDVNNLTGVVSVTLVSNQSLTSVDAGLHKAILQGKVWQDTDADGVQDTGEAGISGVTVVAHLGGSSWTTTTDANGLYSFIDMDAGNYTIEAQPAAGWYVTYEDVGDDGKDSDFDEATKTTDTILVAIGVVIANKDCGLFKPATIGDFIWNDKNRNGVQDDGEPGLDGATVALQTAGGGDVYDVDGHLIGAVTTAGGTGSYSFALVRPGAYKLHFTAVPEFMFTNRQQGGDTAKDSDADPATGDIANVTVASGTTYNDYDAGMYKAVLGDFVWEDMDADGVQDAGEPGIQNVEVRLYRDDDSDLTPSAGDTLLATAYTDASGRYFFPELDHGMYYIQVIVPAGYYATLKAVGAGNLDSDIGSDGTTAVFSLTVGQSDSDWDAGLFRAASVGDLVWEDMDGNGAQNPGVEPGISGATVKITDKDGAAVSDVYGAAIGDATTDANGAYGFSGLRPGTYKLQFVLPGGFAYTKTTGTASAGSDATAPNGWTANLTLVSNQTNNDVDGGMYVPATLSGRVWKEVSNNGVQDAGEVGIAGMTVELRDGSGVKQTTTTGADGSYSFSGIAPGSWHIRAVQANPKLFFTAKDAGGDDTRDSDVDSAGTGTTLTIQSRQNITHMDAGVQACTDIAVTKLSDKTAYNLEDTVTFTVKAQNLGPDAATGLTLSDVLPAGIGYVSDDSSGAYDNASGVWTIGNLASGGSVTLTITARANATGSFANTASLAALDQKDGFPANNSSTVNFTVAKAADLAVTKTVDKSEPWLNDTVVFTVTATNHGPDGATNAKVTDLLPPALQYVSDDSSGHYNSATGVWTIGALANGASTTIKITARAVSLGTVTNTAAVQASEFDLHPEDNSASCTVDPRARADLSIVKTASEATYDAGDSITFTLTVKNLGPDDATGVTAHDLLPAGVTYASHSGPGAYDPLTGDWTIGGLADGATAVLLVTATAGQDGTFMNSAEVYGSEYDPDPTNNADSVDVGPNPCSVGDRVWADTDADGVQDAGEPGLADVTVTLYRDDGDGVANGADTQLDTTVTDGSGMYLFDRLGAGSYYVRVTIPEGMLATTNHAVPAGTDSSIGSSGNSDIVTLWAGQQGLNLDAGLFAPASIGDRVWEDVNANGVQDAGEPGVAGAVVSIRDGSGNAVTDLDGKDIDSFTADADGNYLIPNLRPGSYQLQFSLPGGYVYTSNEGPATTGSDADETTGKTAVFTLASGEANPDLDCGLYRLASLSGLVWKENTNNGVRDAGEAGVAGISVELRDSEGSTLRTATTDANGQYSFTGLVPGDYAVHFTKPLPDVYYTDRDAGTDDAKDSDADASGDADMVTLVSGQNYQHMDAGLAKCSDIAVTKVSDKTRYRLGETIVFTITAHNLGPDAATNVSISDLLPDGLSYVSDDSSGKYSATTGTWAVGSLASGATATLHVRAVSAGTGDFTNTASLAGLDGLDANPANNEASASVTVENAADLSVIKTVDEASPWLGDEVVFTIVVVNDGPDAATNAKVQDSLPASLAYVSDDSEGSYDADSGVWSIGSIAVGGSATLHITARAAALGTATNTVQVSSDEYDPHTADNTDSCAVTPMARADLSIEKTAGTETYASGETIAFTLTVTNNGPDDATGVKVEDQLPDNATYAGQTGDGTYDAATGVWMIGALANDGTATIIITATAGDTGAITNTATVSGNEPDPDPDNNTATAEVEPELCFAGNLVWLDSNGDGLQDAGEPGMPGVTVQLLDASGTVLATDVTDADGSYGFGALPSAAYRFKAVLPEGYTMTKQLAGFDREKDSDGDTTGETGAILLKAGLTDSSVDFGMYIPNSISCRVWLDTDKDGKYDGGEAPLAGVTVLLFKGSVQWGSTVTDSTGRYSFAGLPDGDYTLKFIAPKGMDLSGTAGISADGTSGDIVLAGGEDGYAESGFMNIIAPQTGMPDYNIMLAGAALLLLGLLLVASGRRRSRHGRV